jgi:hypothetical protein
LDVPNVPRPAHAGDVVNYSDFLDSINKGEVEMVRVQNDMLSAQYTTKDKKRFKGLSGLGRSGISRCIKYIFIGDLAAKYVRYVKENKS